MCIQLKLTLVSPRTLVLQLCKIVADEAKKEIYSLNVSLAVGCMDSLFTVTCVRMCAFQA